MQQILAVGQPLPHRVFSRRPRGEKSLPRFEVFLFFAESERESEKGVDLGTRVCIVWYRKKIRSQTGAYVVAEAVPFLRLGGGGGRELLLAR